MNMNMNMNNIIVELIKGARSERGLTQKDLADHLGKTQATISDLERGKVQVSASELYEISQLLNKPIEYFYGEHIGDKEIQDLIAVLRKQSPKDRANVLEINRIILKMQQLSDDVKKNYPEGKVIPMEKVKEFYELFVPFATAMKTMSQEFQEVKEKLDAELKPTKKLDHSKKKK